MELIRSHDVPEPRIERTIGTSRIACVLAFAASVASIVLVYQLAGREILGQHWILQLVAAPFVLFGLLLWLVVTLALWKAVVGSFRSTNWIVKVGSEHLYLNLRCYSNHHLPDAGPTVVRLGYDEIESAGRVRENLGSNSSEVTRVASYLEIRLRHLETDVLRDAVRSEARLEAPESQFLFVKTRSRSTMRPVVVSAPGVIRVVWRGQGMLRALHGRVKRAAAREGELRVAADRGVGSSADDRILALLERGERIAAIELVRDAYGMNLTDADRFVDQLEGADECVGVGDRV